MSILDKIYKLNNGNTMPAGGLGTWQGGLGTEDEEALEESIIYALQHGYRLIDTAQFYQVEYVVGRAVRNCGIPRREITISTKFWANYHHDIESALDISLKQLGLDYVDMFLMHWPWATTPDGGILKPSDFPTFVDTWKLMEQLPKEKCKGIGVCNFSQKTLDVLLAHATIPPAINQVELHALNPCPNLVPYCRSKGIHVMSWGSMGSDSLEVRKDLFEDKIFKGLANKHNTSAASVSLSWAVKRGTTVIPKSGDKTRLTENMTFVELDEEDMAAMNNAHREIGLKRICEIHHLLWVEVDGKRTMHGWSPVDLGWEDEAGKWLL